MNFAFNDEQQEIQRTAREFLASRLKAEKVRELAESRAYDDGVWAEICELGWPGIAIDEEHGGQGLGMVELAILSEELGYACAPTPFLANAAAGIAIARGGEDEQRRRWLPGIASGEALGAVTTAAGPDAVVLDAQGAAVIVVVPEPGGARLVAAEDAEVEPLELIDATRRYARVAASDGEPLEGLHAATAHVSVAVAGELVGVAQRAMEMAVDYAKERQQFGRPIGAYQAVGHRCAQMLYDTEEARSLTYFAAWAADAEPDELPMAAAMAKARASDAAWSVTASALQVFGGIGFTWEHDLQFLLKRARVMADLFGTARQHRDQVASLVGLG